MANISLNRIVDTFPLPFNINSTPYKITDFNNFTKEFCINRNDSLETISAKIIVLGDVAVGKTSLITFFCHQIFKSNYKATIGVDFEVEQFLILGIPFHLQIWDTAGQERFKCIAQSYYRFARVIIIVFDLSKINSLNNCNVWLQEALSVNSKDCFVFLVGTKKDLVSSAAYNDVEKLATTVAASINAEYWAVSSYTGEGVTDLFFRVAALSFDSIIKSENCHRTISIAQNKEGISLKNKELVRKKSNDKCCSL